jgi:hypothetical protein
MLNKMYLKKVVPFAGQTHSKRLALQVCDLVQVGGFFVNQITLIEA